MMIIIWGGAGAATISAKKAVTLIALGLGITWLNDQWRAYNEQDVDISDLWNEAEPCEVPSDAPTQGSALSQGGIITYDTYPDGSPKLPGGGGGGGPIEY